MLDLENQSVINEIKQILTEAREKVARIVNNELLLAYWNIGRVIVESEQAGSEKAEYGKRLLKSLSRELTKELGKGFSVSNLQYMRRFYIEYENQQTLSVKLSWSHYCELLNVSDQYARSFYQQESINSNWSVRELKRQIDTSLFERLLLSNGNANKEKVLALASQGVQYSTPNDILKDPYVFEFLGIPENKPIGIILCADTSEIVAEYALGGLENQIFASKYVYYIFNKEELIQGYKKRYRL